MAELNLKLPIEYTPTPVELYLVSKFKEKDVLLLGPELSSVQLERVHNEELYSYLNGGNNIYGSILKEVYRGKRPVQEGLLVQYIRWANFPHAPKIKSMTVSGIEEKINEAKDGTECIYVDMPNMEQKDLDKVSLSFSPHPEDGRRYPVFEVVTNSRDMKKYVKEFFSPNPGGQTSRWEPEWPSLSKKKIWKPYKSDIHAVDDLIRFVFKRYKR